jgi:hypothetical protein
MNPAPTRTTVTRTALRQAAALVMLLLVLAGVAPAGPRGPEWMISRVLCGSCHVA